MLSNIKKNSLIFCILAALQFVFYSEKIARSNETTNQDVAAGCGVYSKIKCVNFNKDWKWPSKENIFSIYGEACFANKEAKNILKPKIVLSGFSRDPFYSISAYSENWFIFKDEECDGEYCDIYLIHGNKICQNLGEYAEDVAVIDLNFGKIIDKSQDGKVYQYYKSNIPSYVPISYPKYAKGLILFGKSKSNLLLFFDVFVPVEIDRNLNQRTWKTANGNLWAAIVTERKARKDD